MYTLYIIYLQISIHIYVYIYIFPRPFIACPIVQKKHRGSGCLGRARWDGSSERTSLAASRVRGPKTSNGGWGGWGCQTDGGWSPQEIWMEEFFPRNPPVQLDMLDVLKNAGGNHGINHDKPAKPQLVCRSSEAWTVCSKNSGFPILSYSGDWIETINLGFMNLPVLKKTPGLMKSNNQRPWCLHCFLVLMVIYHCFSLANGIPSQKLANRSWK